MVVSTQLEKDLQNAITLYLSIYKEKTKNHFPDFVEYACFYRVTNEKANEIIEKANIFDSGKILSVLASGDQTFDLINQGIEKIDTFDINRLTEYYALGFKKRAVECLNYKELQKLFSYHRGMYGNVHYNLQPEIENYVISNMEEEYKWFWEQFKYVLEQEGFNPSIFDLSIQDAYKDICKNNYAKNEKTYRNFQKLCRNVKITFNHASITQLPKDFDKYDVVYLSNIMDYITAFYSEKEKTLYSAEDLLQQIYDKNLNDSGQIIMTYLTGTFIPSMWRNKNYQNNFEEIILNTATEHAYRLIKK